MNESIMKMYEAKLVVLSKRLKEKQFAVSIVDNNEQLIDLIKQIIPSQSSVSLGGSQTLKDTGLLDELYKIDINLIDRYKQGISKDERNELLRQGLLSDYFITSTNAISMDGALYNIDGTGNRVAAMIFGPKNVLVVCGLNKIANDEVDAINRVRNIASPANAIRLNKDTPCTKLGYCVNCNSPQKICSSFVKIDNSHVKDRIHIIFVKEELGY